MGIEAYVGCLGVNSNFGGKKGLLIGVAKPLQTSSSNFDLVLRGEFVSKGFRNIEAHRSLNSGEVQFIGFGETTVHCIQPSLEVRVRVLEKESSPFVYSGVGLSILLSSEFTPPSTQGGVHPVLQATSETVGFLGACVKLNKVLLDIRYSKGLAEIFEGDEAVKLLAEETFQISFGFSFWG